jgi:hypothetical protein
MRTTEQIRSEGFEALVKALGPSDAIRFMQQFSKGYGNYTEERHQWLNNKTIEDLTKHRLRSK